MMKLIIDRKKWLRGEDRSYLLRRVDNKMCCLGFLSLACGYTEEEISNETSPRSLLGDLYDTIPNRFPKGVLDPALDSEWRYRNSGIIAEMMEINDSEILSDSQKEERLKERFAKIGVEVEFVD